MDRRISKTLDSINNAFFELLKEKEFNKITINDIAKKANINRGTVYLHYTDKFDLIDKLIESNLNKLENSYIWKVNEDGKVDTEKSLYEIFKYFDENYVFYYAMLESWAIECFREKLFKIIYNKMIDLIDEKENKEIREDIATQYLSNAFVGIVRWWIKNNKPYTVDEMTRQMILLINKI